MQRKRRLIFDVGVHRGEDSAYYLALGYDVVGFEADPDLLAYCRRRFARELQDGRLTLVEGAITTEAANTVTFFRHPNSVFGTTSPDWADRNKHVGSSEIVTVPAVNFAERLREFGVPFYLKVDIEGADKECFEALRGLTARPMYVSLESEKVDFEALIGEFDMLSELGYERFAVVQQADISQVDRATRIDGGSMTFKFERHTSGPFGPDVGPWLTRDQAIARYRRIFRGYRLVGDHSWARRSRLRRTILIRTGHVLRRPLPGWYDTHAMRLDS